MLDRNTLWRQGSILEFEHAHQLGLVTEESKNERIVVISHDCDIPSDKETIVEVIKGHVVTKSNSMYEGAKHQRTIHINYEVDGGASECIELEIKNKYSIDKELFSSIALNPNQSLSISLSEKRSLKQWLAARYGRPAYPNAFENRLKKTQRIGKKDRSLEWIIADKISPVSQYIVGIFFDLGEERNSELETNEPYYLSISIVYDIQKWGFDAKTKSEALSKEIKDFFHSVYGMPHEATEIALEECQAISSHQMTLSDLMKVDQWRVEYISINEDEPHIQSGSTP